MDPGGASSFRPRRPASTDEMEQMGTQIYIRAFTEWYGVRLGKGEKSTGINIAIAIELKFQIFYVLAIIFTVHAAGTSGFPLISDQQPRPPSTQAVN
jgi:hypothetical protein